MQEVYNEIIEYMRVAGKRLVSQRGQLKDIGVTKQYLTAEDLRIERDLKKIIKSHYPAHDFFAEEENNHRVKTEKMWVVDPLSGTRTLLEGLVHYGIVVAYVEQGKVRFSAVYDPSVDEMFTAYRDQGAYLNQKSIRIAAKKTRVTKVILSLSYGWKNKARARAMFSELSKYDLYRLRNSSAVSYCHVALGRYDGLVALNKDNFPDYAGSLIVKEAGGQFSNLQGEEIIQPSDRVFIAGSQWCYRQLRAVAARVFE